MKPNEVRSEGNVKQRGKQPSTAAGAAGAESLAESKSEQEPSANEPELKIPPILLEGDEPTEQTAAAPERKFTLGPVQAPAAKEAEDELPEAYGTGRLWLVARAPHSLYANWDLSSEQERQHAALSKEQSLKLRLWREDLTDKPVTELDINPGSHHSFVHVERARAPYLAELGYYEPGGKWKQISASESALTPSGTVSEDKTVLFATVPSASATRPAWLSEPSASTPPKEARPLPSPPPTHTAPMPVRAALPQPLLGTSSVPGQEGLVIGIEESGKIESPGAISAGHQHIAGSPVELEFGNPSSATAGGWGSVHERAIADLVSWSPERRESFSSAELASVSSPIGGEHPGHKEFWLNVNAELVIFGATEPGARVTIAARPVQLRSDGTFSLRFALPDGNYDLPITAYDSSGERRQAEFKFSRETEYHGQVGTHPQEPGLQAPI